MRVAKSCGFGFAACLLSQQAHAASPDRGEVRLELARTDDAHGCIDSKRLGRAVERRLRRHVFSDGDATLIVRVELQRRDREFVAEIEVLDEKGPLGRRELSTAARHCSALDDSLALVVALLVDSPPERPAAAPAPGDSTAAPANPRETAAATTTIEVPRETLAPREPWQFLVRASAIGAFGLLPHAGFGPELAAALRPPRGPLVRATLEYYLPQTESVSAQAGADVHRERVGIELCAPETFIPAASLCIGQRLGRLSASGFGFDHAFDRRVFTFALSGGFDLRFLSGRYFAVSLGGRIEAPLLRHRFDARLSDGSTHEVFHEPALSAAARAGIEVEL